MTADTIRLYFTYLIAILVLIGTFALLVVPSQVPSEQLLPFLTGIVGIVIGFVFNRESGAAASRSTERAISQGANSGVSQPNNG